MKTIVLIGPKHSGKTSAGKALALLCSCGFIDLDELIFQRTGKSPRQLFNEGPAIFQKAEAEAMAALFGANADGVDANRADASIVDAGRVNASSVNSPSERLRVIAAGGGIIDNAEAIALLKKCGAITVYLCISAESAWGRIAAGGELPPFLRTENPQGTHRALHERRGAAYLQFADIVIEAEGKTPEAVAREIFGRAVTPLDKTP
jgi:shikimate kinase